MVYVTTQEVHVKFQFRTAVQDITPKAVYYYYYYYFTNTLSVICLLMTGPNNRGPKTFYLISPFFKVIDTGLSILFSQQSSEVGWAVNNPK